MMSLSGTLEAGEPLRRHISWPDMLGSMGEMDRATGTRSTLGPQVKSLRTVEEGSAGGRTCSLGFWELSLGKKVLGGGSGAKFQGNFQHPHPVMGCRMGGRSQELSGSM